MARRVGPPVDERGWAWPLPGPVHTVLGGMILAYPLAALLWVAAATPSKSITRCWPQADSSTCSPETGNSAPPAGTPPSRSAPSNKDGAEQKDSGERPSYRIRDGLPASWEPADLGDDDDDDGTEYVAAPYVPAPLA